MSDSADTAEQSLGPSASADFTVAFIRGASPAKWFRTWNERYPQIRLGSVQTDSPQQIEVLYSGRAQVSIVRDAEPAEGLKLIPLYREKTVVIAPKEHEISILDSVSVADLTGFLLLNNPDARTDWPRAITPAHNNTYVPDTIADTIELVAAGTGLLVLPQPVARLHSRGDLIYRPLRDVSEALVSLAWLEEKTDNTIDNFIGIVRGRTAQSSRGTQSTPESRRTSNKKARASTEKTRGRTYGTTKKRGKPRQQKRR
ncbi:LysR substrate-binding domain-containing protein [Lysinibacter sp. HNR]|uniref:LysR substrate-binding domain-containing protein n=1 Tax=Lysinibacter sp. HNR TaxID=3031408 RepID=UPI00243606B8|nr:LysR substrate-binding domain-containing protein [Lysinibacter sp. HNR]WGD37841.1 LysR substrate-binding domain-containing protein [Lysinibacter sp. HNR]